MPIQGDSDAELREHVYLTEPADVDTAAGKPLHGGDEYDALWDRLHAAPHIGQRVEVIAGLWRGLRGRIEVVSRNGMVLGVMLSDGEIVSLSAAELWPLEV